MDIQVLLLKPKIEAMKYNIDNLDINKLLN